MARSAIPLYVTNQVITAAHGNTYWRDNEAAHWVGTTAGDVDYYTGVATKSRLAIGAAGETLVVNAGATAPEWGSGGAFQLIEEKLAGGPVASFDFTAIPATYTNLKIICNIRGDSVADESTLEITVNGDAGANYDLRDFSTVNAGTITSVSTLADNDWAVIQMTASTGTAGHVGSADMLFIDYANTTFKKNMICHGFYKKAQATANTDMMFKTTGGTWRSTAAINQITLTLRAGNIIADSKASLYGIK